jgi:C4-dicarboxylate-specific signal transduction histidine kinase
MAPGCAARFSNRIISMTRIFSMSIRAQLFLMALIVALPAAGIIVYAGIQSRQGAIEVALHNSQRFGDGIADAQRNMHISAEQLMSALAKLPEVRRRDAAGLRTILSGLLKQNPRYANIFIADRSGDAWVSGAGSTPFSVADRRYFKNAMATGKFSSGEYAVGRGSSRPAFHFGYPVRDEKGKLAGVIGLGVDLDCFREILEQAQLPHGTSYLLIDHSGVILARGIDPERYVGKRDRPEMFARMQREAGRGVSVGPGGDGSKWVTTYRKVSLDTESQPYLHIRAGIPFRAVVAKADAVLLSNLATRGAG